MGVKAIAVWLNTHGYRTRGGATWGLGPVHALLAHPVYAGRMRFNHADARLRRRKSPSEHVFAEVPAIIEPAVFAQVQSILKDRNPRVTPPRVVTGPILLTGLAVCATCRGAMTLRTGTPHSAARIGRRSPGRESGDAQRAPAAAGEGGLRGRRTAAPAL
jgi:hypothetical protein